MGEREPPGQSKIKIYGPPIARTLAELQRIADELPTISEGHIARGMIPSGETLMGDFDFVFHWAKKPSEDQLGKLIETIDEALESLGCRYTITTVQASTYPYRV
jgi:hypothetical protein